MTDDHDHDWAKPQDEASLRRIAERAHATEQRTAERLVRVCDALSIPAPAGGESVTAALGRILEALGRIVGSGAG